jgi:NAD(P)-dependent dehydrogenase (short-subunit alcohol dehydrogenase family)
MNRFQNSTAMVTGAGGAIGAATAVRLASEGARVALVDRKFDLLDETSRRCEQAGADVLCLAMDQTDRDAVESGAAQVAADLGPVDVLFANAGYGKFSRFLDTSPREWERHVSVNLTGTFNVCQVVAQAMVSRQQGGSIVVNTSSGAVQHADQLSAYCASKAALRMLTVGMASELGGHRIRVNAVMPGVIETAMTAPMLADAAHREVLLADTPVGRLGVPDDVAATVAFLLSAEASYISGHAVMIDGGSTIHGHPRWFRLDYREQFAENWEIGR